MPEATSNFENPYVPSSTRTITNQNFVSALEIYKPSISSNLGQIFGAQSMTGLLETMGAKLPVMQRTFTHYLEDRLHSKLKISTPIQPTAGGFAPTNVVVTGQSKVTRVNDVVWVTGKQRARVTAIVDANTITLVPFKPWLATTPLTGDIAIIGNLWGEGTENPDSMLNGVLKYENGVVIIKDYYEETGSSMTNAIWFEVEGENGQKGYLYGLKGEKDTARKFANHMEMMGVLGSSVAANNTSIPNETGSEGLYDFCKKGVNLTLSAVGDLDRAALNSYLRAHDRLRGEMEIMLHAGYDMSAQFDELLNDEFAAINQGIQFANFNGGLTTEQSIALGFDSYKYQGYVLRKRLYRPFSDITTFGADSVDFNNKILVTPVGTTLDAVTRASIPRFNIRYKANEMGYSREYRTWMVGSQGVPVATTSKDIRGVNYITERGWEFVGANTFGLIELE